jgi:hypothetical protein
VSRHFIPCDQQVLNFHLLKPALTDVFWRRWLSYLQPNMYVCRPIQPTRIRCTKVNSTCWAQKIQTNYSKFPFTSPIVGEVNNAYITDVSSIGGSRKSLNLQPVLLVTPPHHMAPGGDDSHSVSQFSSRTAPRFNRQAEFHHHNHNPMHQFQL